MKHAILLLVIGGVGFAGYRSFLHESPATTAYREFCEDVIHGRYDAAKAAVAEDAAAALPGYLDGVSRARKYGQVVETGYHRVSQSSAGDTVVVELKQVIGWDPPGATSSFGAVKAYHTHTATMKEIGGVWKVIAFKDHVTAVKDHKGEDSDMKRVYTYG